MAVRSVAPGERAQPQSVADAAKSGGRRALLVSTRDRIALTMDKADTPPRDLAALSRQLLLIAKEIEAIDNSDGSDKVSQAAATADESWTGEAI